MVVSDDLIMDCLAAIGEHILSFKSFQDVAEALHRYIEGGSTLEAHSIIRQCTNGQIVNSWDQMKEIPLTKAAQSGQHLILQALIDHPFIEVDMLLVSTFITAYHVLLTAI